MKGFNGYSNYETWMLCLNLDNEEGLYHAYRNTEMTAEELQEELSEVFECENGYKICDFWSFREWPRIDWEEVRETRQDE